MPWMKTKRRYEWSAVNSRAIVVFQPDRAYNMTRAQARDAKEVGAATATANPNRAADKEEPANE